MKKQDQKILLIRHHQKVSRKVNKNRLKLRSRPKKIKRGSNKLR